MNYNVKLGYACICDTLREVDIFTSRTVRLANIGDDFSKIKSLCLANLRDLFEILQWNESMGIKFYRMSSSMFPHLGSAKLTVQYDLEFVRPLLSEIGKYVRSVGHRVTFHPGQFCQLGAHRPEVLSQSIVDLRNHATVFKMMGLEVGDGACMIVHGGGVYGDKRATLERWRRSYMAIEPWIRAYIVIENDDYHYSIVDLMPMCRELSLPLCIDYFHHQMLGSDVDVFSDQFMSEVADIWQSRGMVMKVHVSSQAPGKRKGSHADFIDVSTSNIIGVLKMCSRYGSDCMVEAKKKELATLDLLKQFYVETKNDNRLCWTLRQL